MRAVFFFFLFFLSLLVVVSTALEFQAIVSPHVALNISSFRWSQFSLLKWHYDAQTLVQPSLAETYGADLSSQSVELQPTSLAVDIALYWSPSSSLTAAPWLYVAHALWGAFSISRVAGSFWIKNLQHDRVVILSLPPRPDLVFSIVPLNATTLSFSHSFSAAPVYLSFDPLPDYSLAPKGNVFSIGSQPGLVLFWVKETGRTWTFLDFPFLPVVPCRQLALGGDSPLFRNESSDASLSFFFSLSPSQPVIFDADATWSFGVLEIYFCDSFPQRLSLSYDADSSVSLFPSVTLTWSPLA